MTPVCRGLVLILICISAAGLAGCGEDRAPVLLSRTTPAPTPSTARVLPPAQSEPSPAAAIPPTPLPTAAPSATATSRPTQPVAPTPASTPWPSPTATPAPASPTPMRVHVVAYGETLASIARRYGSTVSAIARANGLTNINRIYAGQRLVLP